jgi:hypothetical protein
MRWSLSSTTNFRGDRDIEETDYPLGTEYDIIAPNQQPMRLVPPNVAGFAFERMIASTGV